MFLLCVFCLFCGFFGGVGVGGYCFLFFLLNEISLNVFAFS